MTTAQDLIDRSVSHTEIASADWSAELADALSLESDDSAETETEVEYWGTREDGEEWRVHLRRSDDDITDEQIAALRTESGEAGDLAQVAICERALHGDVDARRECARVIDAARAMEG